MPIKGLTDREPSDRAFIQIGTVRKGEKKEEDRPGKDLEYFRVEFMEGEEEAAKAFKKAYPTDEPRDLNIILPFDDIDRVWEAWREAYKKGALVHRCDKEYIQYSLNPATGEVEILNGRHVHTGEQIVCNGRAIYHYKNRNGQEVPVYCKSVGRLRIIIPELRRLAYMLVVTTSIHDILNISDQLKTLKWLNEGRLAGIPLTLKRRPRMISTPSGPNGQRARRKKWLLMIEADERWVELKLQQLGMAALPALQNGQDLYIEAETVIEAESDDYFEDDGLFDDGESPVEIEPEDPLDKRSALFDPMQCASYDELAQNAVWHLGYNHPEHVKRTLKNETGGNAKGMNYVQLWNILVKHQQAKKSAELDAQAAAESGDEPDAIPT